MSSSPTDTSMHAALQLAMVKHLQREDAEHENEPTPQEAASSYSEDYAFPSSRHRSLSNLGARPALLDYQNSRAKEVLLSQESTRQETFLSKLWMFLVSNPQSDLIYWHRTGRYLIIPDEDRLLDEFIVKIYRQGSYGSFARQLNIYGFKRINVQQCRDKELTQVPDGSRVWQHEFLTQESAVEELGRVKRHANNKKPSRIRKAATSAVIREQQARAKPRAVVPSPDRETLTMPEFVCSLAYERLPPMAVGWSTASGSSHSASPPAYYASVHDSSGGSLPSSPLSDKAPNLSPMQSPAIITNELCLSPAFVPHEYTFAHHDYRHVPRSVEAYLSHSYPGASLAPWSASLMPPALSTSC